MYELKRVIKLPKDKSLFLAPIGDIQHDDARPLFRRHINRLVELKKQGHIVRVFGCGDYWETLSPSERVKMAASNFHDTTVDSIRATIKLQADEFLKDCKPMLGHFDAILDGHHWGEVEQGGRILNSNDYVAEALGAEYAYDGQMLITYLVNGLPFVVHAMHGFGSGKTGGGKLNKRMQMAQTAQAHWHCMGHDNSKVMAADAPYWMTSKGHKQVEVKFSGIGCFQTFTSGKNKRAGYAEKGGFTPSALGGVLMEVSVCEDDDGKPELRYELRL